VPAQAVAASLRLAVSGEVAATVHAPGERQALPVRLVLPRVWRSSPAGLGHLPLNTAAGPTVPLAELGRFTGHPEEQPILHKDLKRVVFAYAETAGRAPAEVVLDLQRQLEDQPLPHRAWADWVGEGEWQITVQVFRDLGLAFAAALVGIYILLVVQTNSFLLPGLLMLAIPLTLIGILPGFWLLNLAAAGTHIRLPALEGEALSRTIDFHRAIDCRFLIVPGDAAFTDPVKNRGLAETFSRLAERLEPIGMACGYHNHTAEFKTDGGKTFWDQFAERTSQKVILQQDCGWTAAAGFDPVAYIRKYPGRSRTVHFKPTVLQGDTGRTAILGQDSVDWRAVYRACAEVGGTEWVVLEQETYPDGKSPMVCTRESLAGLGKVIG
jgi:sugar phosphate isomerase/epimerase